MPDWESVKASLPTGVTEEDKKRRQELWRQFNVAGTTHLALFELDAAIEKVLDCRELFEAKAAVRRAHAYARAVNPSGPKDQLEFCEFRLLLVYLKGFFEVYQIFTSIDKSRDMELSVSELRTAGPRLAAAGVHVADPEALWRELKGSNEVVDFGEFADWATRQGLAGPELLERSHAEADTQLKDAFKEWSRRLGNTNDGGASVGAEELKRLLLLVDPALKETDLKTLVDDLILKSSDGRVSIDSFIDSLA
eukprot:TRINITY_DN31942_c0_g1_i1.p1 TRINITY_DN31942_c0_g1~~TRINITY_DN31942_c0_g1_i1.p1  ORF type:complete len:251 (+),score=69.57 TRINITY_DN31942_c0_g1_i1:69-821(+)